MLPVLRVVGLPTRVQLTSTSAAVYVRLRLGQFAFPCNTFMLFICTFDAIFELAPIMRELFGHFVNPPGTLRLIAGLRVTVSPTWNLCEGITYPRYLADQLRLRLAHRPLRLLSLKKNRVHRRACAPQTDA